MTGSGLREFKTISVPPARSLFLHTQPAVNPIQNLQPLFLHTQHAVNPIQNLFCTNARSVLAYSACCGNTTALLNMLIIIMIDKIISRSSGDANSCHSITGACSCKAGWKGVDCSIPCSPPFYGRQCSDTCNCTNSAFCDPALGECYCQLGYRGK
jgi:hypothetical protein